MTMSSVVRQIEMQRSVDDWLAVPGSVFAGDPSWIKPLNLMEKQRVSARHNPFFDFGEAAFFVAYRDGKPMGRISAQINHRHLEKHRDETGHFGFFDCPDDAGMAHDLIEAARSWLRDRGMKRIVGPYNLSINEDVGLLVDGFDSPPAILTSHAPPWAGPLLERNEFAKVMDLYAYRFKPDMPPPELQRLAKFAEQSSRVTVRQFNMSSYREDVERIFDIFNDAWSENWGFVPFADTEIAALAKETRPFMRSKFGRIVEIDGEPAAMMVVLPDLNRVIAPFDGRLLPFNWGQVATAILRDNWKTARIPLLGVRKEHQRSPLALAVVSMLTSHFIELGREYNLDWVEFSWVLEVNTAMIKLAELAAGKPSRTYRLYEQSL